MTVYKVICTYWEILSKHRTLQICLWVNRNYLGLVNIRQLVKVSVLLIRNIYPNKDAWKKKCNQTQFAKQHNNTALENIISCLLLQIMLTCQLVWPSERENEESPL